jgi:hypothetical protein
VDVILHISALRGALLSVAAMSGHAVKLFLLYTRLFRTPLTSSGVEIRVLLESLPLKLLSTSCRALQGLLVCQTVGIEHNNSSLDE